MKCIMQFILLAVFCVITFSGCVKQNAQNAKSSEIIEINYNVPQQISLDGLSNESIGWGIKKNKNAPPDVPADVKEMLGKYNGIYIGNTNEKKIFLTFDEGYENGHTADILDTLKKNNVKAAFFITGDYIDREPELVKRMAKEGHILGNHTENHPSLPQISVKELEHEINTLSEKTEKLCNVKMKYVRPPKGEYSEKVLAKISNMGLKTVFWSFAYMDWDVTVNRGGNYAFDQIYPYLDEGEILLLHAVSADNADALDLFIKNAKADGFTFGVLDEIK